MQIGFISDIHNEFKNRNYEIFSKLVDCPILIIAGDLNVGAISIIENLIEISSILENNNQHTMILYVPGNHDYYHGSYYDNKDIFNLEGYNLFQNHNVIILDNAFIEVGNIRIIGSTGWLDHSFGEVNIVKFNNYNDFHLIKEFTDDHKKWGLESRKFITNNISPVCKNVIITHWLPTPECISMKYIGDRFNPCFCNNWRDIIDNNNIKMWIFGHTHEAIDITLTNGTRLLCNPVGYPQERTGRNSVKMITI